VGTPLRSPAFEIESFSPRSESPRPSRRTLHLPGSARGGGSISCPSSASMCGRRTSVPRNRTFQARRIRAERDCVAPIMVVAPSMEVARYEPKFRRDGARGTPRATIASPVSGKELVSPRLLRSQRTTAGTGPGLFLVLTPSRRPSQCCIWLVASFLLASTTGTTPRSPTCPPLPCRGSLLGFASPLPKTTRGHGPRRTRSSLPVSDVSDRGPTSTRPTIAPHRVTIPGGPRPSPFSVSCRNKGHAPGRPFPSLRSMCREVPLPRVHLALHRLAGRWVSPGRSNRLLDSANGVRATGGPDRDAPLRGDAPHRDSRGKALVPLAAHHQSDTGASDSHS